MNYENICLLYINYENMKMFVCKTWIMKIGKYLQYMNYEKMKMFAICKLWEQEIICLQYMKYEKNCKT